MPYKIEVGDEIHVKKQHPCGSKVFVVHRAGMDFRLECQGCHKEIWIKRSSLEKRIKKIYRNGEELDKNNW